MNKKLLRFFAVAWLILAVALSACSTSQQNENQAFEEGYNAALTQMAPTTIVKQDQTPIPTVVQIQPQAESLPTTNETCTITKNANSIVVSEIGGGYSGSVSMVGYLPTYDTTDYYDQDRKTDAIMNHQSPNGTIQLVLDHGFGFFYVVCYGYNYTDQQIVLAGYHQIPLQDKGVYLFLDGTESRYLLYYHINGYPFVHTLTDSEILEIVLNR